MSALKNVSFVFRRRENLWQRLGSNAAAERQALSLLEQVEVAECRNRYPYELSGGQRQRVALAQAVAQNADVMLMDEPFGALDSRTRLEMQRLLLKLVESLHLTVVLVTHDRNEAQDLSNVLYEVRRGEDGLTHVDEVAVPEARFLGSDIKIDKAILGLIEKEAKQILVFTPDLHNDLHDEDVSKAVEDNLRAGKKYIYAMPKDDSVASGARQKFAQKFWSVGLSRVCDLYRVSGGGSHFSTPRTGSLRSENQWEQRFYLRGGLDREIAPGTLGRDRPLRHTFAIPNGESQLVAVCNFSRHS